MLNTNESKFNRELSSDRGIDESIASVTSHISEPIINRSSSKYIQSLRNNFTSLRSDSIECLKRNNGLFRANELNNQFKHSTLSIFPINSNGSTLNLNLSASNNQIGRLKEKFSKVENIEKLSINRYSMMVPLIQLKQNEVKTDLKTSPPIVTNTEQVPKMKEQKTLKTAEEPVVKSPRTLKKYQKSKTSDLSDLLNAPDKSENKNPVNTEFDQNMENNSQIKHVHYMEEKVKEPTPIATVKKTKSILKTSSTINKDEFIDVIPTDCNRIKHGLSPPLNKAFSPPLQLDKATTPSSPLEKAVSPTLTLIKALSPPSSVDRVLSSQSPLKKNFTPPLQIDKALSPPILVNKASTLLSPLNKALSTTSPIDYTPSPKKNLSFSKEIDSIKKMLLEPTKKIRFDYRGSPIIRDVLSKESQSAKSKRSMIKSPSPIRDISVNNETEDRSNKNRNRFTKKKISARSHSVEISKLDVEIPTVNIEVDQREKIKNIRQAISPPNSRPNLTRQNAMTKSLGDNLDKAINQEEVNYRKHRHSHQHHNQRHQGRYKKNNNRSSSLVSSSSSETESKTETSSSESSPSPTSLALNNSHRKSYLLRSKNKIENEIKTSSKRSCKYCFKIIFKYVP